MLMACPLHKEGRAKLWALAGTDSYNNLLQDNKKLKLCTRWFIYKGILHQFNLAREIEQEQDRDQEATPNTITINEPITV